MCMASFYPAGIMPNESRLINGAETNPDGHGFAIVTGKPGSRRLIIHKGMNAAEVITRFLEMREKHADGPALFHSRIATSGLVDVTGCHPFKVGSDNRTVVAHNGVLFTPPANSAKSDTRIFAETMLPRFGSLDSPRKFRKIESFIGNDNKLVILTVNPQRRKDAYLVNEKAGNWIEGEWHSNYDWRDEPAWYRGYSTASQSSYFEPWACDVCGTANAVDTYTLVCDVCKTCNDCHQHERDCLCYTGKTYAKSSDSAFNEEVFCAECGHGEDMCICPVGTAYYRWDGARYVKVTAAGANS